MLDGAGFGLSQNTLAGDAGIHVVNRTGVTVKNMDINCYSSAIHVANSSNIILKENNIHDAIGAFGS